MGKASAYQPLHVTGGNSWPCTLHRISFTNSVHSDVFTAVQECGGLSKWVRCRILVSQGSSMRPDVLCGLACVFRSDLRLVCPCRCGRSLSKPGRCRDGSFPTVQRLFITHTERYVHQTSTISYAALCCNTGQRGLHLLVPGGQAFWPASPLDQA